MEWLSHSQKKYCELCKTPFRFTKLYDPNMPQEIPVPVFLKELVLHVGRYLLAWVRCVLVAFVWLGWLPWSMRAVWRGLFWLADGRWPGAYETNKTDSMAVAAANATLNMLAATGTSPASPVLQSSSATSPGAIQNLATAIPQMLAPVSSILNFSAGEPLIYSVAKTLFSSAFASSTSTTPDSIGGGAGNATSAAVRRLRQPSWLSDVTFLTTLTPYPTVNNIIIDTLEGQLITLLVVVSFILVFLIREWVVQQQPVLNVAEGEREAAAQLMEEDAEARRAEEEEEEENNDEQLGAEVMDPEEHDPAAVPDDNMSLPHESPALRPSPSSDFHLIPRPPTGTRPKRIWKILARGTFGNPLQIWDKGKEASASRHLRVPRRLKTFGIRVPRPQTDGLAEAWSAT
jgi:E3 ubiquitin-protein ligase MARCH6